MKNFTVILSILFSTVAFAQTELNTTACVPLQQGTIPFLIQGAKVDSQFILGGLLPKSSRFAGTYGVSKLANDRSLYPAKKTFTKTSANGSLTFSTFEEPNVIQGWLQLSSQIVNQIMNGTQLELMKTCVKSISIEASFNESKVPLIYLQLDNGSTIGPIYF